MTRHRRQAAPAKPLIGEHNMPYLDDSGDPYNADPVYLRTDSDMAEWGKMQAFTPAPDTPQGQNAAPWWQNLVSYGVTKAIDNTFPNDPRGIQGNTKPGSFAGQNGRTYNQRGAQAAPPTLAGFVAGQGPGGYNWSVLGAIAVGAWFLIKKAT